MLSNVINLGAEPVCADNLEGALQAINDATPSDKPIGFGHAILSDEATANCNYSSILMLRTGTLKLASEAGITITLQDGEVATLPSGKIDWKAENADCIILLLRADNPELSLAKLDLDHPLSPGGQPNAALLTTPAPETARHEFYYSEFLSWGLWRATPYARQPIKYSFSEVMMLRKGEVTLANSTEGSVTFKAGDIFIVQPDAIASWDNTADLEKFWIIRTF